MDKYIGKRLDGRYEIHELIGVGGMAKVYRCNDTVDDREVAVKILKDEYLNNEEFIRRFKNESKAIAMLSHQNIVKVYDVSFGDMIQYIVMEYIDGITLKEYIDQQGVIDWKDTLHLVIQVLKALQHAHECGIVHRDIKPQNIMLLQDGTIKVTDFGIARFSDKATKTMTEQAIGSVHYIAPEQARGESTDGKSDIYSVGVMLYEMLSGKLPFDGESAVSVALMQLQSTPKLPREINPAIPLGLEQITMRAMEKNPDDRYTSAAEMLSDIERFRQNPSIVFDYGKSFVDNQPTKFVSSLKDKMTKPIGKKEEKYEEPELETEEMVYEDDEIKQHKPAVYAIEGILIATFLVCAVFFVLALFRGCNSTQALDVDVPNYVGQTLVEIKENNPYNFNFEIKSQYDESKQIGEIISQEPEGGSMKVKTGSTLTLTVNGTDTEVSVPFVENYSEENAVSDLKKQSLVPQVVYVENTKTPKGYAIDTFPKAGVKSTIGSTVYVFIASGERPELVTIPSVTGLQLSEAKNSLESLNLSVEIVYDDDSIEPKDTVLGMSPLQYGKVEEGTLVELRVSSGKGNVNTVSIYVDLPNTTNTVDMKVIIDGVVDTEHSKQVVPAYNKTSTIQVKGSGTKTVVVQLDGNIYKQYLVDFATSTVTPTGTFEYQGTTEPSTADPYGTTAQQTTVPDYTTPIYTTPTESATDNTEPTTNGETPGYLPYYY
ncbi:MAG: Stk1 family PASTA domain-containing Ser/Thr kinase [Ruminococcus sp.]|nr:Stk1 family PASTA domain-containing Ser/Thr kinase [Ruminococcus sp.]